MIIQLFKEMTIFLIKIDDFGDIIEFVKNYVNHKTDWSNTLSEAERISISEEDMKLCWEEATPTKPEKTQDSLWKKLNDKVLTKVFFR